MTYTVSQKKHATILLSVTSPNVDRFTTKSVSERILKISQHLAKLQTKV